MTSTPPPSLQDFIRQHVREQWEAKGQALLLARLGQAAIASGINLRVALGDCKLADFIARELAGEVEVEPCPDSPPHLQAKPAGQAAPAGVEGAKGTSPGGRLHRALWLAFSRPITTGHQRRLQVEPVVRFWDMLPPLTEVAGRLPIEPGYIAPSAEALAPRLRDEVVMDNIRRWMRDNALDVSKFESGRANGTATRPRVAAQNPLMQLIAALDDGELKRVMLPLDVVAKLLKK